MRKLPLWAAAALSAGLLAAPASADHHGQAFLVLKDLADGLSACNIDKFAAQMDPEGTLFPPPGGNPVKIAEDIEGWRAFCEEGGKAEIGFEPISAEIMGDVAVVTGRHPSTIDPPGEEAPRSSVLRVTAVMVKKDGAWKIRHAHLSFMAPPGGN